MKYYVEYFPVEKPFELTMGYIHIVYRATRSNVQIHEKNPGHGIIDTLLLLEEAYPTFSSPKVQRK